MAQSIRVSVVLPCYNCGDTLHASINSIIRSTVHARESMGISLITEIIAVDDGSSDHTANAITDLQNSVTQPFISFKGILGRSNQGAGRARQEGTRHATAPYLCFLDADDEFLPRHLGLCVHALHTDRSIGYVWTERQLDVPIHSSWEPSLDRRTVMNLCVRKVWHELSGGFPSHPDFRSMSTEDSFYRLVLEKLVFGRLIPEKTVLIHFSSGNSLDRQKVKFNTPIEQWDSSKEEFTPSANIINELEERLAYVEQIAKEIRG